LWGNSRRYCTGRRRHSRNRNCPSCGWRRTTAPATGTAFAGRASGRRPGRPRRRRGCLSRRSCGRGARASMVASAVAACRGVLVLQPGDDLHVLLDRFERRHRGVEGEVQFGAGREPVILLHPVGDGHERHPQRRGLGRLSGADGSRQGRQQSRQGHSHAESAQKIPPGESPGLVHGWPFVTGGVFAVTANCGLRMRWNGADSTTPCNRALNWPPFCSSRSTMMSTVCSSA
jgi:hypothetical protein